MLRAHVASTDLARGLPAQASPHEDALLHAAIRHAAQTIDAPYARIWLADADGSFVCGAAYGYVHDRTHARRLAPESVSGLTIRSGLLCLEDAPAHPWWRVNREFGERTGLGAYLGATLTGAAGPIGVLELMRATGQPFQAREVSQLRSLVDIVGEALDATREETRLRQALQNSREAAQEAQAVYIRTMAVARHELRSYLARLKLQVDLLLAPDADEEPFADEARDDAIGRVRRTVDGAASLVEGLLAMTDDRLLGPTLPARIDVARLARRLIDDLEHNPAAAGRLRLCLTDEACEVEADQTDLDRLIVNLVDNAVKYSPGGEPIDVVVEPDGAGVAVRVSDRGTGFPSKPQAQFEPFARGLNALARGIPGSGLGLYVCRELVTRYGGRIWVDSPDFAGGTTVGVWLPSSPSQLMAVQSARVQPAP